MLMISAWEALLKARILDENGSDPSSIAVFERKHTLDGSQVGKKIRKKNRSGNSMTIDLIKCMEIVRQYKTRNIDDSLIKNLNALIEIRDNAVHLLNVDPNVYQVIHRTGTAAMLNLLRALQSWFEIELNEYGFIPLPIGYYPAENTTALSSNVKRSNQNRLVKYLQTLDEAPTEKGSIFNATVDLHVSFTKSNDKENIAFRMTKDLAAPQVRLTEADFSSRFPFDYKKFCSQIKSRDKSIKVTTAFHTKLKILEQNESFCWIRKLDPKNPKSSKKKFYSPQAVDNFFQS